MVPTGTVRASHWTAGQSGFSASVGGTSATWTVKVSTACSPYCQSVAVSWTKKVPLVGKV